MRCQFVFVILYTKFIYLINILLVKKSDWNLLLIFQRSYAVERRIIFFYSLGEIGEI